MLQRRLSRLDRSRTTPRFARSSGTGGLSGDLGHYWSPDRKVMAAGPATWHESQLVPIIRHGRRDDPDAPSGIGGVLVAGLVGAGCLHKDNSHGSGRKRTSPTADRQWRLFEQALSFIAVLEGPEHRITFANAAYMRLVGDREVVGRSVSDAFPGTAARPGLPGTSGSCLPQRPERMTPY
jgi:hypothetical protein